MFFVGEYWSYDLGKLKYYLEKTEGCMSLFDAPLQNNFYTASRTPFGGYDMRTILDNTLMQDCPVLAVTVVDNHDNQPCQALEHWVDWWFKPLAYSIILLRQEGYPSVFYPDLYGAEYSDKNHDINLVPLKNIEKLILERKNFAYGAQHDYFDDRNTIGWIREGDDARPGSGMAVLLTNGIASSKWMKIGEKHTGKSLYDYLGNRKEVIKVNNDGWAQFLVDGGSVSVWVLQG